jgi:hypothetical protein
MNLWKAVGGWGNIKKVVSERTLLSGVGIRRASPEEWPQNYGAGNSATLTSTSVIPPNPVTSLRLKQNVEACRDVCDAEAALDVMPVRSCPACCRRAMRR